MIFATASNADIDRWMETWNAVTAHSLVHAQVTTVDADTSVEDACEVSLPAATPVPRR